MRTHWCSSSHAIAHSSSWPAFPGARKLDLKEETDGPISEYLYQLDKYERKLRRWDANSGNGSGNGNGNGGGYRSHPIDYDEDSAYQALIRQRAVQMMNEKEAIYTRLARRGHEKKVRAMGDGGGRKKNKKSCAQASIDAGRDGTGQRPN